MATDWNAQYAERMDRIQSSIIREILKMMAVPGIISFAGGMPAPELFPKQRIAEATSRLMSSDAGTAALQYGVTEGYLPLREFVIEWMSSKGLKVGPENVFMISGAQQGLDLIGKIMIDPGDRIIVEEPTYLGAMQAWNVYGAEYVTVETDKQGIIPEALEEALKAGPAKLIYLVPTFQNPTGITLTAERRAQIVELADQYGVPIVEDDPYGELRYEGAHIDPLVSYDARQNALYDGNVIKEGNVIYLGTFSKSLCPGVRLGWAIAPEAVARKMIQAKQSTDLHTSTFGQMVVYETVKDGFLEEQIQLLCKTYRTRRNLMIAQMEEKFPEGTTWIRPEGGLFIWSRIAGPLDSQAVLKRAIERGVAFVPGAPFYPHGGGKDKLRMNFSNATPDQIKEGISRLAEVFHEVLDPELATD